MVRKRYNGLILNYERLWNMNVMGETNYQLKYGAEALKRSVFSLEITPIRDVYKNKSSVSVLCLDPLIDCEISQTLKSIYIVTYSFHEDKSRELLSDIGELLGIRPVNLPDEFRAAVKSDFNHIVNFYNMWKRMAKEKNVDIERIFGALAYKNNLEYCGMSEKEAVRVAKERFELNL